MNASAQCETLVGVDGVHCAACISRLESALAGKIDRCEVDLATRTAAIRYDASRLSEAELLSLLERGGFGPRRLDVHPDADAAGPVRTRRLALARIGIGVLGSMQVMMFAWPSYTGSVPDAGIDSLLRWAQLLVATPTVFWAGWPFFAGAARSLRGSTLTMDVPVALSLALAWAASAVRTVQGDGLLYFDTATMFVALLLIGRHLESMTRARASERLCQLADAEPTCAIRLDGDRSSVVALDRLVPGDRLRVMPGEAVPADGTLETVAELDESLLTGESHPVTREVGQRVIAGSLNLAQEPLVLRAEAIGGQTRVAQMRRLLARAALRKPPIQVLSDRIAGHFTLAILALAAIGGLVAAPQGSDAALQVVLSVLVASCPCALSLAVPAVLASVTSRLAARGVLVARADRLLRLPDVDVMLLDKTGTLTQSQLSVQRCETTPGCDRQNALRIVAALESGLAHPVARAFAEWSDGTVARDVKVQVGRGVSGIVGGVHYAVGPARADAVDPDPDPALSWITLSDGDGVAVAHFGLGVQLRSDARSTIAALHGEGVGTELLTGDGPEAAERSARAAGIPRVAARQSPEDKLVRLRRLQQEGRVVLAVGDGLNDAAFLAAADVSAAMPAGSAATQARADLILVGERLSGLRLAREAGRQAVRRMRENLAWAALYNIAILPLAFSGELQPWIAAAGMSASSLLVVANALRVRLPEFT